MSKNLNTPESDSKMPKKRCRRCGCDTVYSDFGWLSILCDDCKKIEKNIGASKELDEFDKNPVHYDINAILHDKAPYEVLAYFANSLKIPDQRLLPCEKIPTFAGRLSCEWRNGFHELVVESNHGILFTVLPTLRECGATNAAEAVSECLTILDQFGYRKLIIDFEEPYFELTDDERGDLEEALNQLDLKWDYSRGIDTEMEISAYNWVLEHRDEFRVRAKNPT
jgi:hypothetical protein